MCVACGFDGSDPHPRHRKRPKDAALASLTLAVAEGGPALEDADGGDVVEGQLVLGDGTRRLKGRRVRAVLRTAGGGEWELEVPTSCSVPVYVGQRQLAVRPGEDGGDGGLLLEVVAFVLADGTRSREDCAGDAPAVAGQDFEEEVPACLACGADGWLGPRKGRGGKKHGGRTSLTRLTLAASAEGPAVAEVLHGGALASDSTVSVGLGGRRGPKASLKLRDALGGEWRLAIPASCSVPLYAGMRLAAAGDGDAELILVVVDFALADGTTAADCSDPAVEREADVAAAPVSPCADVACIASLCADGSSRREIGGDCCACADSDAARPPPVFQPVETTTTTTTTTTSTSTSATTTTTTTTSTTTSTTSSPEPSPVVVFQQTTSTTPAPETAAFPPSECTLVMHPIDQMQAASKWASSTCPDAAAGTAQQPLTVLASARSYVTQSCTSFDADVGGTSSPMHVTVNPQCRTDPAAPQQWLVCSWSPVAYDGSPDGAADPLCEALPEATRNCCRYVAEHILGRPAESAATSGKTTCRQYVEGDCQLMYGWDGAKMQVFAAELRSCTAEPAVGVGCTAAQRASVAAPSSKGWAAAAVVLVAGALALAVRRRARAQAAPPPVCSTPPRPTAPLLAAGDVPDYGTPERP